MVPFSPPLPAWRRRLGLLLGGALSLGTLVTVADAQAPAPSAQLVAAREAQERELRALAEVHRSVMMPMSDGTRLMTDVYVPKQRPASGVPLILSKTPYNMNWWDVRNGAPRDLGAALTAVKRGYAYALQNERGHFFSEGEYDILGPPITDGRDAIDWFTRQGWSNGKVGLIGCSSTAEYQMAVASTKPKGLAAIIPQGYGAGVGRIGPWYEQGNWYRGGAVQMLFIAWLYGEQNTQRPLFPASLSQDDLTRLRKSFDLAQQQPRVDWSKALWHLPMKDLMRAVDGPRGIYADTMPVATGGAMIYRTPNDPAWYKGGLYHDDMPFDTPALWFMSWYDVSVGPNIALWQHAMKTASPEVAKQQHAVIAPVAHCAYTRASANMVVGERPMGDPRLDYDALTYGWFDTFLKGENTGLLDTLPRIRYFTMGSNKWQASDSWPPRGAAPVTWYLSSAGNANTMNGSGVLLPKARRAQRDTFSYDPANPVMSYGGNVCCTGTAIQAGSFDQRVRETRPDILVYTSEPLEEPMEVSGPVSLTLYVSSDAKDTDFTVKLIDVDSAGRAWNLDETIQRMRYHTGYDRPQTRMELGRVYKVTLGPLNTSNLFRPGHRVRIEVSSSNFPRFDRNLNTGGDNVTETRGVVAHNAVHHGGATPSSITLSVVKARR
ncbi:CocE/NonD family hydrolase [Gemmatimonas sp.]|uniref:CocE/NonD family hydrolase n=1 Tax=Gemmatimonas sp. TaxID=1962908 RepID=UPI0022C5E63E|nr:CocE/NonD family hydrolase [Gemmatimonas sp.]MCZ8203453.1 CocE/NonD family hydrolase [Gemmatimonas sp.]